MEEKKRRPLPEGAKTFEQLEQEAKELEKKLYEEEKKREGK